MIRPASVGEIATMTGVRGHQAATAVHGDAVGGVFDQLYGRLEHDVVGDQGGESARISLVPPTNRVVWAPPSDSAKSSAVTPQV